MHLPVSGFEPTSSVFLGECVTHWATVEDIKQRIYVSPKGRGWVLHNQLSSNYFGCVFKLPSQP